MSEQTIECNNWHRVIIDDTQFAKPANFISLLETAMKHAPSSIVKADRLELIPSSATESLISHGIDQGLSIDALCAALESITQLVWGRFFLFANSGDAANANLDDLAHSIAASQITACVVDNSSCFVFTKSASLVCELLAGPWRLEVLKGDLLQILARREDF
jgi:hypothetical protein